MPVKRPSGKAPSPRNSLAVCSTPSADMRHLLRTELVGRIHDRMPAILRPEDYSRWLALDPDGPNLLQPFPSEPMIIWFRPAGGVLGLHHAPAQHVRPGNPTR